LKAPATNQKSVDRCGHQSVIKPSTKQNGPAGPLLTLQLLVQVAPRRDGQRPDELLEFNASVLQQTNTIQSNHTFYRLADWHLTFEFSHSNKSVNGPIHSRNKVALPATRGATISGKTTKPIAALSINVGQLII
jgi:hypothetical protein